MPVTWDAKIPEDASEAVVAVETTGKPVTAVSVVVPVATPVVPSSSTLSPPVSHPPPNMRHRSVSNVSTASTTDPVSSTSSYVPAKRQRDFEQLFGPQLRPRRLTDRPADFLTVLQTQSADLQASVLLHGRLYLTAYHLCFRSNIVGYITEKIYSLNDILKVEKSTTAKWIQNAVSLTVVNEDGEDEVVGYGSMKDRDAMYEEVMEVWKIRAPKRWEAFMKADKEEKVVTTETERGNSTSTIRPAEEEINGEKSANGSDDSSGEKKQGGRSRAVSEVRHTEASGEKYDNIALDTKIPIPMDQLFGLLYHNKEFQKDFLEVKQKLTDVEVSEWADKGGKKERRMTYVMHMNNRIGPKKSDCIGTETIEVEDPDKAYEIVSETQTPDIPSGKSFKIRTRACLSHTGLDNNETPATRLHCTTQCDWSASSMLKSTITPAVIKGQKEYHQKLLAAVLEWIKAHPDDFETQSAEPEPEASSTDEKTINGDEKVERPELAGTEVAVEKGTMEQLTEIPGNQAMSWITILCALSLALNLYLLTRRC